MYLEVVFVAPNGAEVKAQINDDWTGHDLRHTVYNALFWAGRIPAFKQPAQVVVDGKQVELDKNLQGQGITNGTRILLRENSIPAGG